MKKILVVLIVSILFGASDIAAYNKRHWELLRRTKCCQTCQLREAPLSRIDLTEADMREADLRGADFRQATLYKAVLPKPEMYHGANFTGAMWVDGRICKKGSISHCKSE